MSTETDIKRIQTDIAVYDDLEFPPDPMLSLLAVMAGVIAGAFAFAIALQAHHDGATLTTTKVVVVTVCVMVGVPLFVWALGAERYYKTVKFRRNLRRVETKMVALRSVLTKHGVTLGDQQIADASTVFSRLNVTAQPKYSFMSEDGRVVRLSATENMKIENRKFLIEINGPTTRTTA